MGRERTGRGSVAPRSHAFRSVMAAAQTLLVRSRRVHMHTPRRRAPAGRPAGLVALAERGEKERPRKTERKRGARARALSSVRARCVHWIFGDTSPPGIPGPRDHSRNAPYSPRGDSVSTRTLVQCFYEIYRMSTFRLLFRLNLNEIYRYFIRLQIFYFIC